MDENGIAEKPQTCHGPVISNVPCSRGQLVNHTHTYMSFEPQWHPSALFAMQATKTLVSQEVP